MWQQLLYQQVLIDNKFYVALPKFFSIEQRVLRLIASVQYLKTSLILCEEGLDATKLYIWRTSILDTNGISHKNARSVMHFWPGTQFFCRVEMGLKEERVYLFPRDDYEVEKRSVFYRLRFYYLRNKYIQPTQFLSFNCIFLFKIFKYTSGPQEQNRPFPSFPQSLFQSGSKCESFVMIISSDFNMNKK